ncbi:unnamed protein product [Brachionus calyciflorus]|uniref:Uncharacterized protein n=1 Tax=Brachionus calyciflorus TaxID=104777 RepID=A0A813NHP9_9BILA|nr:unnamed protein product [Brachionus calyciflorus]
MVAKIKNSFLKNSFHLFCYRTYLKDNSDSKFDDDLKRLSTSFPNLCNADKKTESKLLGQSYKSDNSRSHSANGRCCPENNDNLKATEIPKPRHSLKTLKQIKKKNDSEINNLKNRSKSSLACTNRVHYEENNDHLIEKNLKSNIVYKPPEQEDTNQIKNSKQYSALSSLKFSKKLQSFKKSNKHQLFETVYAQNASTTNSILLRNSKRYITSANEKKAVRFADSLGLELENVITLNNHLDMVNQIKNIRMAKNFTNVNNYAPVFYTDNDSLKVRNHSKHPLKVYEKDNLGNLIDFNDSKIEEHYLNRTSHQKMYYAEPKVYSNSINNNNNNNNSRSNYYQIYEDTSNMRIIPNLENVNNYYTYNNKNIDCSKTNINKQIHPKISITTRLNNGKLESEV